MSKSTYFATVDHSYPCLENDEIRTLTEIFAVSADSYGEAVKNIESLVVDVERIKDVSTDTLDDNGCVTELDFLGYKIERDNTNSLTPLVVLIAGKAGSGKDYVAAAIKESIERKYPKKRVMITHFADLLKYLMTTYENWNGEKDEAGRRRLQQLGTDIVRKWDSDYWAKRMCEFIYFYKDMYDIFIIPDLRFVNEYIVVSNMYVSKSILVTCPDNDSVLTEEQQHHISETDLCDLDGNPVIKPMVIIENHKDEEESTKGAVDSIVDKLIKGE